LPTFANSVLLGLIDNVGIAKSLSQKIQSAASAKGPAQINILNAFENEVNAQSGKHLTSTAPQVLLQDAASLIAQSHWRHLVNELIECVVALEDGRSL
jgi:hypothetical protein